MPYPSQHMLAPGELLNERGELCEAGYANHLAKRYSRAAIKAGRLRIKEWDYYCVTGEDAVLAMTIADNGYMGLDSITLIDLNLRWQHTQSFMRAFPMGKTGLPDTSERGDVAVRRKGYELSFANDGAVRELCVRVERFFDGKPLTARVRLTDAPEHSMVIATPFAKNPKAFYYNQKINCLRAAGEVAFDGTVHRFTPESAMAVLDWGRGVWTYKNTWYWSSLSGLVNGEPFGLNLGYGFGDTSAATENMLFYRGQAHKLEHVVFDIPKTAAGGDDFLKPWQITANDGRVTLAFTPLLDRAALTSALVIESDQHQIFGYFDGQVLLDDGTELTLPHLLGFAEKVRNKW
ncbi:MAG: DUF2804 domain-containing protein [Clostridia bacterium]